MFHFSSRAELGQPCKSDGRAAGARA